MHQFLARVAVTIHSFVIGVVLTWLLASTVPVCSLPAPEIRQEQQTIRATDQKRQYKWTSGGKLATADGYPGSFSDFDTSDGMSFSRVIYFFDSPRQANRELQKQIKQATIISREPAIDDKGKRVGEKLVVKFKDIGAGFLWTNGSELFVVDSSSVENILEYVKDSKR